MTDFAGPEKPMKRPWAEQLAALKDSPANVAAQEIVDQERLDPIYSEGQKELPLQTLAAHAATQQPEDHPTTGYLHHLAYDLPARAMLDLFPPELGDQQEWEDGLAKVLPLEPGLESALVRVSDQAYAAMIEADRR